MSHGIENTDDRLDSGKPELGTLIISVSETQTSYVFQVSDDGCGIHPEAISQAALKKGTITTEDLAKMSDLEKQWLIFLPSVSTASEVTEISGRGVGMDAVFESVKSANAILTMDSRVGRGTLFTITLDKKRIEPTSQRAA